MLSETFAIVLTVSVFLTLNIIKICVKWLEFSGPRHDLAIFGSSNGWKCTADSGHSKVVRDNRSVESRHAPLESREEIIKLSRRSIQSSNQRRIGTEENMRSIDLNGSNLIKPGEKSVRRRPPFSKSLFFFFFFFFLSSPPLFSSFFFFFASRDNRCRYRERKQKLQDQNKVNRLLFSQSKSWNWGGERR